ncbi:hypothetical protein [Methyloprofundus sedimenti]|nr:hypothetical protein [Methyloprofundus sedimenti]
MAVNDQWLVCFPLQQGTTEQEDLFVIEPLDADLETALDFKSHS